MASATIAPRKNEETMLLAPAPGSEDKEMLRQAAMLTRDLHKPNPVMYWGDCFGSATIGYAALLGAIASGNAWLTAALVLLSILTLYRAALFIHEITHLDHRKLPGFRLAWNIGIGAPLMLPSFLYEGIHAVHHSRVHYGTERDPEYIPLAHMRPWSLPLFTLGALVMPAMPAFYQGPRTLDDLADFMAGKILGALGFSHELYPPWSG